MFGLFHNSRYIAYMEEKSNQLPLLLDINKKQLSLFRDNAQIEAEFAELQRLRMLSLEIESQKAERIKFTILNSRIWQNK